MDADAQGLKYRFGDLVESCDVKSALIKKQPYMGVTLHKRNIISSSITQILLRLFLFIRCASRLTPSLFRHM